MQFIKIGGKAARCTVEPQVFLQSLRTVMLDGCCARLTKPLTASGSAGADRPVEASIGGGGKGFSNDGAGGGDDSHSGGIAVAILNCAAHVCSNCGALCVPTAGSGGGGGGPEALLLALGRSLESLPSDIANGIKSGKVHSLVAY